MVVNRKKKSEILIYVSIIYSKFDLLIHNYPQLLKGYRNEISNSY
jgi:hypothetical protein